MIAQQQLEEELKHLIVDSLMLEDVTVDDIGSDMPLFEEGLGLDSIDALELGMAISKKYNIKMSQDQEENKTHFANVGNLASYVSKTLAEAGK